MIRVLRQTVALLLLAAIASCAHEAKNVTVAPGTGGRDRADAAIARARQQMAANEYEKALETLQQAYGRHPSDAPLQEAYVTALEQVRGDAEREFTNGRYELCGLRCNALLRRGFQYPDVVRRLSFDRDLLNERIRACAKVLTEDGLAKYREGRLDDAIAVWKRVLAFDPKNADVKRAVETAQLQRDNLNRAR